MFKTLKNLIKGPNCCENAVYNGNWFRTRIRQFFRKKTYKSGQVLEFNNGTKIRLTNFVRYNNVFSEIWEYDGVTFPNIKGEISLDYTEDNIRHFGIGKHQQIFGLKGFK